MQGLSHALFVVGQAIDGRNLGWHAPCPIQKKYDNQNTWYIFGAKKTFKIIVFGGKKHSKLLSSNQLSFLRFLLDVINKIRDVAKHASIRKIGCHIPLHICVKICLGSLCVYCPEIIQETSVNVLQYRMHGQSSNPGRNQTWDGDNFQVKQRLATAPSTDKMTTKRLKANDKNPAANSRLNLTHGFTSEISTSEPGVHGKLGCFQLLLHSLCTKKPPGYVFLANIKT